MIDHNCIFFVYTFSVHTYSRIERTKIGVSKNPWQRLKSARGCSLGFVKFYDVWMVKSRKEAFRIEAIVKNSFDTHWNHEVLNERPDVVSNFVSKLVLGGRQ